jgi:hypothetical protein
MWTGFSSLVGSRLLFVVSLGEKPTEHDYLVAPEKSPSPVDLVVGQSKPSKI